jgi:hypothetical protein
LGKESRRDVQVAKVFAVDAQETGVRAKAVRRPKINGHASNGHLNGHVNGINAIEIDEDDSSSVAGGSDDDSNSDEEDSNAAIADCMTRATMMSVRDDGQWLACADSRRQVNVYNLDVLKVSRSSFCLLEGSAKYSQLAISFIVPSLHSLKGQLR